MLGTTGTPDKNSEHDSRFAADLPSLYVSCVQIELQKYEFRGVNERTIFMEHNAGFDILLTDQQLFRVMVGKRLFPY